MKGSVTLCSGESLVYPHGGLSSVAAKGQMDREEVQWEDIYANSSMSVLLGVLNTARVKTSFPVQRGIGAFC